MTERQKFIIEYLVTHEGQGYLIDIRDNVAKYFDNEDDFDKTMHELINLNMIYENEYGDTLYKLHLP